jgi:hypothetical protein
MNKVDRCSATQEQYYKGEEVIDKFISNLKEIYGTMEV